MLEWGNLIAVALPSSVGLLAPALGHVEADGSSSGHHVTNFILNKLDISQLNAQTAKVQGPGSGAHSAISGGRGDPFQ